MICYKCKKEVDYVKKDNHWCRPCFNIYMKEWMKKNRVLHRERVSISHKKAIIRKRKMIWDYLKDKKCVDCGISNKYVLQFDHVRGEKKDSICQMASKRLKWETILEEIKKCDIVCANCHQVRTMKRGDWSKLDF